MFFSILDENSWKTADAFFPLHGYEFVAADSYSGLEFVSLALGENYTELYQLNLITGRVNLYLCKFL